MNDNFQQAAAKLSVKGVLRAAWKDAEGEFAGALWFVLKPVASLAVLGLVALFLMAYTLGAISLALAVCAIAFGYVASTVEMKKKILGLHRERSFVASLATFEFWIYTFVAIGATITYLAAAALPVAVIGRASFWLMDAWGYAIAFPGFGPGVHPDALPGNSEAVGFAAGVLVGSVVLGAVFGVLAWSRLGLITTFVVAGRIPSYLSSWRMISGNTFRVFLLLVACNLPPFVITAGIRTYATLNVVDAWSAVAMAALILLVSLFQALLSSACVARIYLALRDLKHSDLPDKRDLGVKRIFLSQFHRYSGAGNGWKR